VDLFLYCFGLGRYGWVSLDMYESLRQGTEWYTEALEQVSVRVYVCVLVLV